jgi:hypothetical protein
MIKFTSGSAIAAGLLLAAAHHGALPYVVAGTGGTTAAVTVWALAQPPGGRAPRRRHAARWDVPGETGWHVVSVTVQRPTVALPARLALPPGDHVE